MATVHKLDPLRDARWEPFVNTHPKASVFHTNGWLEALRRTYGYKPIVMTTSSPTGELKNGIVFCQIHSWLTGSRIVSLPFAEHCEPLVDSSEDLSFLLKCLQAEMQHEDWKYLELRPANGTLSLGAQEDRFGAAQRYCYHRLDLRPNLESIFQSFDKDSIQRRIRRAEHSELACMRGRSDQLLRDFYEVLLLTRSRHRLPPQPYAWFQNLIHTMGPALELWVAYLNNVPVASILTLHFQNTVYYKYGCSNLKFKNLGATALLLWKAIENAKTTGANEFDFGRSEIENTGLITFKDHWVKQRTQMVYWRYPVPAAGFERERRKLDVLKPIFGYMPHKLLAVTGRLIYRHIG